MSATNIDLLRVARDSMTEFRDRQSGWALSLAQNALASIDALIDEYHVLIAKSDQVWPDHKAPE